MMNQQISISPFIGMFMVDVSHRSPLHVYAYAFDKASSPKATHKMLYVSEAVLSNLKQNLMQNISSLESLILKFTKHFEHLN
jgi:hypothetical protein